MTRLLHISDLHFGRLGAKSVQDGLLALAADLKPEGLVCSGDLVQRGDFRKQFTDARAFIDRFQLPTCLVPGNHDLPLFKLHRRLLNPYGAYRAHVSADLQPIVQFGGAQVIGLCTPRWWLADLGYVSQAQISGVTQACAQAPPDSLRIVVMHHPLLATDKDGLFRHHVRGAARAARGFSQAGVDIVLHGHNHFPCVREWEHGGKRLVVVQAGTATSRRVRPHTGCQTNAVNVLDIDDSYFSIRVFVSDQGRFVENSCEKFARRPVDTDAREQTR